MNKNESKYFNTAQKMDEALITLLEKKELAYITVSEICKEAGVNRSTFYLHYETIQDLLKETTEYIINKHFAYYSMDTREIRYRIESGKTSELFFVNEKYLTPYLAFIKDNRKIFTLAIKEFKTLNFGSVYENLFVHVFTPILEHFRVPKSQREYIMKFYLNGIVGIIMEWLGRGCEDDTSEIIKIIEDCVMGERNVKE
jgi:AcrR family transcriptional regulator